MSPVPHRLRWAGVNSYLDCVHRQHRFASVLEADGGYETRRAGVVVKLEFRHTGIACILLGRICHQIEPTASGGVPRPKFPRYATSLLLADQVSRRTLTPKHKKSPPVLPASFVIWWSQGESNPRPLECHSSALPTELRPHASKGQ